MRQKDLLLAKFTLKIKTEFITSRNMEEFLKVINRKFNKIIDVRLNTYYKSNQGFNPKDFKTKLDSINIEYQYIMILGNPFHHSEEEFKENKNKYINYLNTNLKANKCLETLFKEINSNNKKVCLICYCNTEDPLKCHRFWLKETLVNMKREKLGYSKDYVLEFASKSIQEIVRMKS